ncbi:MAG: CpsB/CapC family capsule biosynthesis tyrosine phosphatase [Acetobacterium sp.]|uniref:tyrosine-protein phosphatase n=1 Tax=Acetobacterium sp. TaxID=1872094 RepID=UPI003241E711
MIDTHIHMVPGVDDGAKDMNMSIQMIQMVMNEGVNKVVLTPHYNLPRYQNENVEKQFNLLKDYIKTEKINFEVYLGNEIYLSEETMVGILEGQANSMAESSYLLVELPYYHYYPVHEAMIQNLQHNDFRVLLAHIERYQIFEKKPEKLRELVENGVYAQLSSRHIIDHKTRKSALQWIENGLIHIVASDGHDVDKRPPLMRKAYDVVAKAFGMNCAQILFEINPQYIIEDSQLMIPELKKPKRFKLHFT